MLDAVPGSAAHPDRPSTHISRRDGALVVAEAGADHPGRGRLGLGLWQYTAAFPVLDAGSGSTPAHGNRGAYAFAETRDGSRRRLDAFARLGLAAGRFNAADRFASAGIVLNRVLPGRPEDQLGFAVALMHQGGPARAAARAAGAPIPAVETSLELTWRAEPAPWLALQPTLQYVRHPGGSSTYRDALVLGLRVELSVAR
ncbi:MAG: carbohydrate porin [Steroidobacteraceae bacterium]